jgi:protease-4
MAMLNFFKSVLTCVVSSLLSMAILFALLLFSALVVLVIIEGGKEKTLDEGTILVLDLNMTLSDTPSQGDLSAWLREVFEDGSRTASVREVVQLLREAAADEKISSLVIKGSLISENYGSGLPAVMEVGRAISHFRETGKKVYAWLEVPEVRDYLLATHADEIHLSPSGVLQWNGLKIQGVFLSEFLQRNGIRVHVYQAGKYKGAADTFERQDFSPELREQWQRILDEQWGFIVGSVASARGISAEKLRHISQEIGILEPQLAQQSGMVDHVSYFDEFLDMLRDSHGGEIHQVTMEQYASILQDKSVSSTQEQDSIAVVYIEGDIVAGESVYPMCGGDTYSREIRRLREDPTVKAVVIRVNSPGGVAYAGEQIAREIALTSQVKPVVASMGTYAASAGYMVVAPARTIFTDASTLTGSIGAFMLFPDFEQIATEHGVSSEQIVTGPFAGILSPLKSPTPQERAVFERLLHNLYGEFLGIVMKGRNLSKEQVDAVAQGQIWTGEDAVHNGLADQLGGLEDTIQHVRQICGDTKGRLQIVEFPGRLSNEEMLAQLLGGTTWPDPLSHEKVKYLQKWLPNLAKSQLSTLRLLRTHQKHTIYSRLPFGVED